MCVGGGGGGESACNAFLECCALLKLVSSESIYTSQCSLYLNECYENIPSTVGRLISTAGSSHSQASRPVKELMGYKIEVLRAPRDPGGQSILTRQAVSLFVIPAVSVSTWPSPDH